MSIQVKNGTYIIDGEEQFLISGEFPYFRVPRKDWEERLIKMKEAHGNCVSSYVPWLIHEPAEGEFLWGDVDNRDLCGFLDVCQKLSINVMLRPGPMQYSELVCDGLPTWIYRDYPDSRCQKRDGSFVDFPSYMNPVFLEKARKYFASFAETVRKYLHKNGGPIAVIQLDNELMGCHIGSGTIDYNRVTCGFGKENGAYPLFLQNKYGTIEKLNEAYDENFASFAEVFPGEQRFANEPKKNDVFACRSARDFFDFYLSQCAEYLYTLSSWLREDGIEELVCHNAANPSINGLFDATLERMGENFLLASDHYYNLNQDWPQNNPTPQYALKVLFSCEQMRNMGMPATVLEMPAGSCSDFPPILPQDLYSCYSLSVAMGLKGINYYIFTGGPNFEQTGNSCDIYDYNALIRADGTLNETYYAAQRIGKLLEDNKWLQSAERVTSVNVGYENELFRSEYFEYLGVKYAQHDTMKFIRNGMLYALMASPFAPGMVDISKSVPDTDKPLILCCPTAMSEQAQKNAVTFLEKGGKVILMPTLPTMDEEYRPCTILKDYVDIQEVDYDNGHVPPIVVEGCKNAIYYTTVKSSIEEKDMIVHARNRDDNKALIVEKKVGDGTVIFGTTSFTLSLYTQVDMMERLLSILGAKEVVKHSNPHIFTSYFKGKNGEEALFLMNLYASSITTDISLNGKTLQGIQVDAMDTKIIVQ